MLKQKGKNYKNKKIMYICINICFLKYILRKTLFLLRKWEYFRIILLKFNIQIKENIL